MKKLARYGPVVAIDPLFGDDRNVGPKLLQAIDDDGVGGKIGLRHRGAVRFVFGRDPGDVENGRRCARHEIGQRLQQRLCCDGIDHSSFGRGAHACRASADARIPGVFLFLFACFIKGTWHYPLALPAAGGFATMVSCYESS